jgi:peptidoglycan/xylan/chitin deacetylase (PgdA/CDA1 family)
VLTTGAASAAAPTVVSLTFNDGLASQYQFARPVLRSHGVNGTFYVASNWVATLDAKYMRSWQHDELSRDGNEIGGMGTDHKDLTASYAADPAADLAYKQDQVCGDRQRLADLGYAPVSFSYPFAATNAAAQSVVGGCGYLSGRTVGGLSSTGPTYAETVPPANALRVSTLGTPNGPITLAAMQAGVNAAAARGGGWVPLAFNAVCDSSDSGYTACMNGSKPVDAAVLSQFLDWVASSAAPAGTTVKPVRAVMGAAAQPALPPRPTAVSLTFDDGDRSQYGLRQMLAARQKKATFYINSGAIDDNEQGAMTWPMVTDLATDGHDIGGHTKTHISLTGTDTSYFRKWSETCDDRARLFA